MFGSSETKDNTHYDAKFASMFRSMILKGILIEIVLPLSVLIVMMWLFVMIDNATGFSIVFIIGLITTVLFFFPVSYQFYLAFKSIPHYSGMAENMLKIYKTKITPAGLKVRPLYFEVVLKIHNNNPVRHLKTGLYYEPKLNASAFLFMFPCNFRVHAGWNSASFLAEYGEADKLKMLPEGSLPSLVNSVMTGYAGDGEKCLCITAGGISKKGGGLADIIDWGFRVANRVEESQKSITFSPIYIKDIESKWGRFAWENPLIKNTTPVSYCLSCDKTVGIIDVRASRGKISEDSSTVQSTTPCKVCPDCNQNTVLFIIGEGKRRQQINTLINGSAIIFSLLVIGIPVLLLGTGILSAQAALLIFLAGVLTLGIGIYYFNSHPPGIEKEVEEKKKVFKEST
ncbi:MAG: hypothetical protein QW728_04500 [Thermoplasmata archaeon]